MRRSAKLDFCRDILPTSDNEDVDDNVHHHDNSPKPTTVIHLTHRSMPSNPVINRLCLLPAYPTFGRFGPINRDHLLLVNVPRRELTIEQRRHRDHYSFHQPFTLIDESNDITIRPFFVYIYQQMYVDLAQRFHIDNAILDYNYERLRDCINIMTQERIRYGLLPDYIIGAKQMRIDEYALALEFYLQIDAGLFFMKTCAFRNAQPSLYNHRGIFCIDSPQAHYGMQPCRNITCRFCFPISDIATHSRQEEPVIRFSAAQKHRFVNGYEAILNCPVSCATTNILYALTCPCGQFDYIGYTPMSLGKQLIYHREHGNRIIHEFLLGQENIDKMRQQSKSDEELAADDMLLYKHSARCSSSIQMFLDCNPQYWFFVPMEKTETQAQNLASGLLPTHITLDSTTALESNLYTRRGQEAVMYMNNLPAVPSDNYTFSAHQRAKQIQTFKDKSVYLIPNFNLDLYNATIIAVLPDSCSDIFYQTIEALFITHAQTKLNTLGHLDGMIVDNNNMDVSRAPSMVADRGNWCQNLVRRPTMFHETRTITTSHRVNPHFQ